MTSSSSTSTAIANAVSGKTARPCDCRIKRRARWYCASDDALLCQECDTSVHSANPLARRHDRVRLKTFSSSNRVDPTSTLPSWHRGPTRKARSARQAKHFFSPGPNPASSSSSVVVPELDTTSSSQDGENEEDELLCRVPILDPFAAQLEGRISRRIWTIWNHEFFINEGERKRNRKLRAILMIKSLQKRNRCSQLDL